MSFYRVEKRGLGIFRPRSDYIVEADTARNAVENLCRLEYDFERVYQVPEIDYNWAFRVVRLDEQQQDMDEMSWWAVVRKWTNEEKRDEILWALENFPDSHLNVGYCRKGAKKFDNITTYRCVGADDTFAHVRDYPEGSPVFSILLEDIPIAHVSKIVDGFTHGFTLFHVCPFRKFQEARAE